MDGTRIRLLVCVGLLWATAAAAQEPPSVADAADRPGFADSPVLVSRGHLLFESGLTWEHEGSDRASAGTLTWPQMELHGGISSRLDLAVLWDGVVTTHTRAASPGVDVDDTTTGLDDLRLGLKVRLVRRPHLASALIAYASVPVGSASVTNRYADPYARLAWSIPISDRVALSGTADLQEVREGDDHVHTKPAASAAIGRNLTATLNGFIGIVSEAPDVGSRAGAWSLEAGLERAIGDRHQVDIWVSRRVAGDLDDWFISAGFIRRLR